MSGIVGQNILDNSGLIKAPAGGGAWNFIKKLTASTSATLSFVDGTDDVDLSTYKEYLFTFNNVHPSTYSRFVFQGDVDGSTSYDTTITSTRFTAYNQEHSGTNTAFEYQTGEDQAQGTDFHRLTATIGYGAGYADNDQAVSGYLQIFNPSSSVYVKHFISETLNFDAYFCYKTYSAGYFNTTSALDKFQFKFSAGNMDSGDICLYGLTT